MSDRRVRPMGRGSYGRAMPLSRPRRRIAPRIRFGQKPRRLLLLVVAAGLVVWAGEHAFAVKTISVSSPGRAVEIKAETKKDVSASWRQQNLLTLDAGSLADKLQQADPLLSSVNVRRSWPNGVVITAVLRQSGIGWSTGEQKYLLDRDGTAIGALPQASKLPMVTDGTNLPVNVGQRVASTKFVAFVTALVPALASHGIGVTGLSIKDTTLDLDVSTNKGYYLVLDTGRGVDEAMSDLVPVLTLLAAQKKTPASYIDLRIAGKAYYR